MKNLLSLGLACSLLFAFSSITAYTGAVARSKKLSAIENLYGDVSDANTILRAIDSGLLSTYEGKDRAAWERFYSNNRAKLAKELESFRSSGLSGEDTRAIVAMRKQMKAFTGGGALSAPRPNASMHPAKILNIGPSSQPWSPVSSKSATASALSAARLTGFPPSTCYMRPLTPSAAKQFSLLLFHCGRPSTATTSPTARIAA